MVRVMLAVAVGVLGMGLRSAGAEGVKIEPGLEAGTTLKYEIRFVLERGLTMGAGRDRLVQDALLVLDVAEVDAAGVATVNGSIDWVVLDLDRASFRVRVDSRDVAGDSPNLAETTIREMVAEYLESSFTMRVAPSGDIMELTGFEKIVAMLSSQNGSLVQLAAGRLLPAQLKKDLEPIWRGDGAVGRELSVDDTWASVRESELGLGVMMRMETAYRVSEVDENAVRYGGDMTATIVVPETEEPLPVTFSVIDQSGHASGVWDLKAGALGERSAETSYTMVVGVEGAEQGSQRTGSSSLKLVSVEKSE